MEFGCRNPRHEKLSSYDAISSSEREHERLPVSFTLGFKIFLSRRMNADLLVWSNASSWFVDENPMSAWYLPMRTISAIAVVSATA